MFVCVYTLQLINNLPFITGAARLHQQKYEGEREGERERESITRDALKLRGFLSTVRSGNDRYRPKCQYKVASYL